MYYQTCRLIDNHQLVVFIDHIKWDIFWFNRRVIVRTIKHQCDDVTGPDLVIALDGGAIDLNETGVSCFLDTIA